MGPAAGRVSTSGSNSLAGSNRVTAKIRHHGKAGLVGYSPGDLVGGVGGVPMRLSASEVEGGDSDDDADSGNMAYGGGTVLGAADAASPTQDNLARVLQAGDGVREIHRRTNDRIQWTMCRKRARRQCLARINGLKITSLLMGIEMGHAVLEVEVVVSVQMQWES